MSFSMLIKNKKLVYVALSGGVDSSVSAALLKQEGYDVVGVFIKVWQPPFIACVSRDDRRDAMRVAAHLGISFKTLDLSREYKREVVDYMIAEYKAGRTPNPDVTCNKKVKFGAFFDFAMGEGAHYVATGHYARVRKTQEGLHELLAGVDKEKDQSYFLWTLTQKHLAKTLFPVGGYKKEEVRKLAGRFNLHTAGKKDSQGLCFVGKIDMPTFLRHFIREKKGAVLNERGEIVGTHEGAFFPTLGQRHGFSAPAASAHAPRLYIVGKDMKRNTLTVSPQPLMDDRKKFRITDAHWIGKTPRAGERLRARARYRQKLLPARLSRNTASFSTPLLAAPGQSVVFYRGNACLGGAVIA